MENLTSFYTLLQHERDALAAVCLAGNPSPACRHLLSRLAERLPAEIPLYVWADIDYGGLNILAQLRRQVSPRFAPNRMNVETLDAFARWGQPLPPQRRPQSGAAARPSRIGGHDPSH